MKVHYDKKVDALYIAFRNGRNNGHEKVSKTIEVKDFLIIDLDRNGKMFGIEILDASRHVALKGLVGKVAKKK